jgi:hypothetical protein
MSDDVFYLCIFLWFRLYCEIIRKLVNINWSYYFKRCSFVKKWWQYSLQFSLKKQFRHRNLGVWKTIVQKYLLTNQMIFFINSLESKKNWILFRNQYQIQDNFKGSVFFLVLSLFNKLNTNETTIVTLNIWILKDIMDWRHFLCICKISER